MNGDALTRTLLALLTAAIVATMGVVWRGSVAIEVLSTNIDTMQREILKHVDRPWHERAGHLIAIQSELLQRLESQLASEERTGEQ